MQHFERYAKGFSAFVVENEVVRSEKIRRETGEVLLIQLIDDS